METREWKLGDRLVHTGRPEWGLGEVRSAMSVVQDGRPCQRLTVRFDRAGVKVLTTAYADLKASDVALPTASTDGEATEPAWPPADSGPSAQDLLVGIPEAATDPFRPRKSRLEHTFGLYRFTGSGTSLLDWAAAQTGLKDPLSRFSRHELEQLFARFRTNLDAHLKKLALETKRQDPAVYAAASAAAPSAARHVLGRIDSGR